MSSYCSDSELDEWYSIHNIQDSNELFHNIFMWQFYNIRHREPMPAVSGYFPMETILKRKYFSERLECHLLYCLSRESGSRNVVFALLLLLKYCIHL